MRMGLCQPFVQLFAAVLVASLPLGVVNAQQTWDEQSDAPDLIPGQETVGNGPLTLINGTTNAVGDIDLYRITITDHTAFSASTIGLTDLDTTLFLFDSDGNGVAMDDDDPNGSGVQSIITNRFVRNEGYFYLGISTFDNKPDSSDGAIWLETPFDAERAPDGPGSMGSLMSWSTSIGYAGSYGIALTGARFATVANGYSLSISGDCPGTLDVQWSGASPSHTQAIVYGLNQGSTVIPPGLPCAGTLLGVQDSVTVVGNLIPTGPGNGMVSGTATPFVCGHFLQLVEGQTCNLSNVSQIP